MPAWTLAGWTAVAGVVLLGAWLRITIATGELLWLDELHTGWAVAGSFADVFHRSAAGNQSPLFFMLTWCVAQLFGSAEWTLRLVSLVAGIGIMVAAGVVVLRSTKSVAAVLLTVSLIAIDDGFLWYSTEARPYSLLHLVSLIQVLCVWRLFEKMFQGSEGEPTRRWIDWSVVGWSLVLVYVHYTAVLLLVGEAVVWLAARAAIWFRSPVNQNPMNRKAVAWQPAVGTALVVAIGMLPLVVPMLLSFERRGNWESVASIPKLLNRQFVTALVWIALPIVIAGVAFLVVGRGAREEAVGKDPFRRFAWCGFLFCWYALPAGLILVLHRMDVAPLAMSRYLSVGAVAAPVFAGVIVGGLRNPKARWIAATLVLAVTLFVFVGERRAIVETAMTGRVPLLRTENWKAAVDQVNASEQKRQQPLFLFAAVIEDAAALQDPDLQFQNYLQFPVRSLYRLTHYPPSLNERVVFAGPTMEGPRFNDRLLEAVVRKGGAWILVRHDAAMVNSIVDELRRELVDFDSEVQLETQYFGAAGDYVVLVSVDLYRTPATNDVPK